MIELELDQTVDGCLWLELVQGHRLIKHEFFYQIQNGTIGREAVLHWAQQQYFMSISLAPCFAALYARVPVFDWQNRVGLMALAAEETWGYSEKNHGEAFVSFYKSIGGDVDHLDQLTPTKETKKAAEGRLKISRGDFGHDISSSAMSLAWANEYANQFIFGKLQLALRKALGNSFDGRYFKAHIEDEESHSRSLIKLAEYYSSNPKSEDQQASAIIMLLDLRAHFFDRVLQDANA